LHKTKEFFYYNEFNRKVIPPGAPLYFGDHLDFGTNPSMNPAWLPHGRGEFRIDRETIDDDGDKEIIRGEVKLQGYFDKGLIHGTSHIKFKENNEYTGDVRRGILHGTGVLTEGASVKYIEPPDGKRAYVERIPGKVRPAILRNNLVVCYQDELMVGKQIEIDDPTFRASSSSDKPRAVLVHHVKDWKYRIRLNDELHYVERVVDLQGLKSFKVLHHLPLIHTLTEFNIDVDTKSLYKYDEDVFKGKVKYEIEGDRRKLDMTYHNVVPNLKTDARTTDRRENFFEPLAIGIGTAVEEEEKARIIAAKKKQFDDMIEKKRKDEEEAKQRMLQEEQERTLNAAREARNGNVEVEIDSASLEKMIEDESGVRKKSKGDSKKAPKRVRNVDTQPKPDMLVQMNNAYLSVGGEVKFAKGILRAHSSFSASNL
jgi:hypothetical protein